MNDLNVIEKSVVAFGYPMSNLRCRVCHQRMYVVATGVKRYGDKTYGFEGYKCAFCGHEHIEHVSGGVLGDVKK